MRLSASLIAASLVLAATPARAADEPPAPPPAQPIDPLQNARSAIVAGDPNARTMLVDVIASAHAAPDRAAAAELLYVVDTWASRGRPTVAKARAPMPSLTSDWPLDFATARGLVVDARFADAAVRLEELFGVAPDLLAASRARALRDLSREAMVRIPAEPATLPRPTPSSELPPAEESLSRREPETHWYGWQTLIVDGLSLVILFPVPAAGLIGYAVGPPVVHAIHGRIGASFGSLAMRVLLPPLGAVIGASLDGRCNGDFCIPTGLVVGFLLGAGLAIGLDAAVLAHEKVEAPTRRASLPRLLPVAEPRREGGVTFGVLGQF